MPAVTQKKHQPTRKPLNYTARQDCTKVTILYCGLGKSCNCDCTVQVYFTRTNTQTSQLAWASLKSHQILKNWPRVCLSLWRLCCLCYTKRTSVCLYSVHGWTILLPILMPGSKKRKYYFHTENECSILLLYKY